MTEIKTEFLDKETMKFRVVGELQPTEAPDLEDFLSQPVPGPSDNSKHKEL